MNENDILGFDPSQLKVFDPNDKPKSSGHPSIYTTKCADSKAEDGVYRCTLKVIYNPFDFRNSILEQQSYSMQDSDGWFSAVSSLTVSDTTCPIFKAWKKCHFAKKEENFNLWRQAAKVEDGGRALFDKRFARYCVVQVLADENQPENVGKYMFWKLPKAIYELIQGKINPSKESKKPIIPVMDFLFGRSIDLEVIPGPDDKAHPERKARETRYTGEFSEDVVSCTNPDGSPLLNDEEQAVLDAYVDAMNKVWKEKDPAKRTEMMNVINNDPNTAELKKIYPHVLEDIKKFCPNLIEELGYKPWSDELTARVQKWIDVVLSGNVPGQAAPTSVTTETTTQAPVQAPTASAVSVEVPATDSTDDLPF